MATLHNGKAGRTKEINESARGNSSKTNLKLALALLLPPVNAKYHLDLWEKQARRYIFIGFIWEVITIHISNLQH